MMIVPMWIWDGHEGGWHTNNTPVMHTSLLVRFVLVVFCLFWFTSLDILRMLCFFAFCHIPLNPLFSVLYTLNLFQTMSWSQQRQ